MKKVIVSIVLVLSVVLFSNCSYAEEKGLAGLWKFDEGKGDIAKDAANNKNNGKVYGATWTKGKLGKALKFDGVDDYVDCGKDSSVNFGTGDFSISVWIKSNDEGQRCAFVGKDYYEASAVTGYGLGYRRGLWRFQANDGTVNALWFRGPMGSGWRHVVGVRTATNRYLYVDGVLVKSDRNGGLDCDKANRNLHIGSNGRHTPTHPFNGAIDEVRIYSRALSSTEVDNLYKMGSNEVFVDKGQQKETKTSVVSEQDNVVKVLRKKCKLGERIYGKLEFLDVSLNNQLVHLEGPKKIPLRLSVKYRVLDTAPVLLKSPVKSGWTIYNFDKNSRSVLNTPDEKIDLSKKGEFTNTISFADVRAKNPEFSKGMVYLSPSCFRVSQLDGEWLRAANNRQWWRVARPMLFSGNKMLQKLTFTLANLSSFSLEFAEIESNWEPGAILRVKLIVTDADGDKFPVINAPVTVKSGKWKTTLETEMDYLLHTPTGWLRATLPREYIPQKIKLNATVNAITPNGPSVFKVSEKFKRGEGKKLVEKMSSILKPRALPRNADGIVRETRGLWISWDNSLYTKKSIEKLVERAHKARLNTLIPLVFGCSNVARTFFVKSSLSPISKRVEKGLDPLAYLIKTAHAKGIEVHPYFSIAGRDKALRDKFEAVFSENIDVKAPCGLARLGISDVHNKKLRDFLVDLIVGVARDYNVDGINLDYIRTGSRCYCERCSAEFQKKFGKPITEGTDEEWVIWQKEAVGDIVKRVAEGAKAVKPRVMISAAVKASIPVGATQGQDPVEWVLQGWMDAIMPMDYSVRTFNVYSHEKEFLEALDDKLVTILCLYWRKDGHAITPRSPELVKEQIELVRRMGIHGYGLFSNSHLSPEIIEMLKTDINKEKAVPYFR